MSAPKVFISYSHDSDPHKEWVLQLATELRKNGVDTILDQWDLSLGQDIARFMQDGISEADRVLLICTEKYVGKAEAGQGGVGYERMIVTAEMVQTTDTIKFIPVLTNNAEKRVPGFLGARRYVEFRDSEPYQDSFTRLLREVHGLSGEIKPEIGPNPFSSDPPKTKPGVLAAVELKRIPGFDLNETWFDSERAHAEIGIANVGLRAYMELRFGAHGVGNFSQIDLLNSVRKSEVHTFGWPIGILLEGRDEYKPRPYKDGIRAEVAISKDSSSGRESYDYWSLRSDGSFFLLQSLFEDQRSENMIFFNTRIVRVAEAVMFACRLYKNLGLPDESQFSCRIRLAGLAGRVLGSSNPSRSIRRLIATDNEFQKDVILPVATIEDPIEFSEKVMLFCEPLFMLFDFQRFERSVYEDIVTRFFAGEVT